MIKLKPRFPKILIPLGLVELAGLVALFIASKNAFALVVPYEQAVAAALTIDTAMVAEGITLMRKNYWAALGIVVSLLVAGTYNFIQVEQAGRLKNITNGWELLMLAVGPLAAVFSLALVIGREYTKYETASQVWDEEQAAARAFARQKLEQTQRETEEREAARQEQDRLAEIARQDRLAEQARQDRLDREARERQLAHARELAQIEAEKAAKLAEIEAQQKKDLAQIRAEARIASAQVSPEPKVSAKVSLVWRKVPPADRALIAEMTTKEVMAAYEVSERTAQNWIKWAKDWVAEQVKAQPHDNGIVH